MINPIELRIGNYIHCTQLGGGFYRVCGLRPHKTAGYTIQVDGFDFWILPDRNDPIPITPEILKMCGFAKDVVQPFHPFGVLSYNNMSNHIGGANKQVFTALYDEAQNLTTITYNVDDAWASNNIPALHDLQNFYFALTRKELNVVVD